MLRTGVAILARPSPMRDAGWWPRRQGVPTGLIFPRTTSGLTWSRAPAPVRRGMSPEPCCQRGNGTAIWIGPIVSSGSMRRDRAQAGRCGCIPRKRYCSRPTPYQQSEAFTGYRRRRVVVEHRLARLVQLGIRQSRYFGRAKTLFQLYLAATVANLTLGAAKAGMTGNPAPVPVPAASWSLASLTPPPIPAPRGSGKFGHSLCSRRPYCHITPSQQGVSVRVSRSLSDICCGLDARKRVRATVGRVRLEGNVCGGVRWPKSTDLMDWTRPICCRRRLVSGSRRVIWPYSWKTR